MGLWEHQKKLGFREFPISSHKEPKRYLKRGITSNSFDRLHVLMTFSWLSHCHSVIILCLMVPLLPFTSLLEWWKPFYWYYDWYSSKFIFGHTAWWKSRECWGRKLHCIQERIWGWAWRFLVRHVWEDENIIGVSGQSCHNMVTGSQQCFIWVQAPTAECLQLRSLGYLPT